MHLVQPKMEFHCEIQMVLQQMLRVKHYLNYFYYIPAKLVVAVVVVHLENWWNISCPLYN